METLLKIQTMRATILSYKKSVASPRNVQAGYDIALALGILETVAVDKLLPPIDRLCVAVAKNLGSGDKVTSTAFRLTDAVCNEFGLNDSDLAKAYLSIDTNNSKGLKDKAAYEIEARGRTHLGFFLLGMAYRSKLIDIANHEGTPIDTVETFTMAKAQPAAIVIKRMAKSSGKPNVEKKFKLQKELTRSEAEAIAQEWIDTHPKGQGAWLEFEEATKIANHNAEDKIVGGRREPYYVIEKGGSIEGRTSFTSFSPFDSWTSNVDHDGRILLNGRGFQPSDEQMKDAPWVRAANRLESVEYKVNRSMLELIEHFNNSKNKDFLGDSTDKRRTNKDALRNAHEIGEHSFYTRCFVDFRGRMYLSRSGLNFQGGDLSRSLMDLARGEALTADGFESLLLHAANCHGEYDGQSRQARISFAHNSLQEWKQWGADPIANLSKWHDQRIEKPFSFIRACIELAHVGVGDVSHIIAEIDGSNNGLQWHAILMADADLAAKTNLLGGERNDFYKLVGDRLKEVVGKEATAAERRKIAKKASMLFQYGASTRGIARDLLAMAVDEPRKHRYLASLDTNLVKRGNDWEPSDDFMEVADKAVEAINAESSASSEYKATVDTYYRSRVLRHKKPSEAFKKKWEAAKHLSPRERKLKLPKALSGFLTTQAPGDDGELWHQIIQDFIDEKPLGDRAIRYTTPSNFPVHIEYFLSTELKGRLYLDEGVWKSFSTRVWGNEIDRSRLFRASLANVTHSIDATHCHLILDNTDYDLVTIHDAYCCHPNNGKRLVRTIMEQMKRIADQYPLIHLLASNKHSEFSDWEWLEYEENAEGNQRASLVNLDSDDGNAHLLDFKAVLPRVTGSPIPAVAPNPCVSVEALEAFS